MGNPIRCLLVILVAVLVSCPAAWASQGTTLKQAVENAEVIRSFPLGGASVGEVATGEDCIVLGLQQEDSSTIAAFTHSGDLLFWRSVASPERPGILISDVSDDGSTIVIAEDTAEYAWRRVALDHLGNKLCEFPVDAMIRTSPGGRFFCPKPNDFTNPEFEIYDRLGSRIEYSEPYHHDWNAAFLSDSIIALIGPFHVRLVGLPSAQILATTRIRLTKGYPNQYTEVPSVVVSRTDSVIVVHNGQGMEVLSFDGKPLFTGSCCGGLVPSAQGEWLAHRCSDWGDSAGYFYVTQTRTPWAYVRSERIPLVRAWYPCDDCEISWFSNGILATWNTAGWDYWRDHDHCQPYQTLFIEFHPETATLDSAFAVPGLYRPVHGEQLPRDTYLRIVPPDTVQLVRFHRE